MVWEFGRTDGNARPLWNLERLYHKGVRQDLWHRGPGSGRPQGSGSGGSRANDREGTGTPWGRSPAARSHGRLPVVVECTMCEHMWDGLSEAIREDFFFLIVDVVVILQKLVALRIILFMWIRFYLHPQILIEDTWVTAVRFLYLLKIVFNLKSFRQTKRNKEIITNICVFTIQLKKQNFHGQPDGSVG